MDILTAIKTRRSIRYYTDQPIADDVLSKLLEAAMYAPSAHNKRPWHFVVIRNREELARISEIQRYHKPIGRAACCIIVCGDESIQANHDLLLNDCSAATQNILLAVHELGLGAVWCGVTTGSDVTGYLKDKLPLPQSVVPISLVALGYPAEERKSDERFETSKIHFEKW
jgi:nitroreductase